MALWSRLREAYARGRVPLDPAVRAAVGDGERVVAHAIDTDGRTWAGTSAAAYVPGSDGPLRVPWTSVERATWDRDTSALLVVTAAPFGSVEPRYEAVFAEQPLRLVELVHERVTSSIVATRRVHVRHGLGVRVVVRRAPGTRDEPAYLVRLDAGLEPDDPGVVEATRQGLAEVRDELGADLE